MRRRIPERIRQSTKIKYFELYPHSERQRHAYLTSIVDIYTLHSYLTFISDIYILHLSGIHLWRLYLTFISDVYIWYCNLYLTFISDIYIWHLYLACGSIHFPRLFSKQSWKMYWIHISRLFSKQSWKMDWIAKPFVLPLQIFATWTNKITFSQNCSESRAAWGSMGVPSSPIVGEKHMVSL